MQFRHIALIALWTLISGPLIGVPTSPRPTNAPAPTEVQASRLKKPQPATKTINARWSW